MIESEELERFPIKAATCFERGKFPRIEAEKIDTAQQITRFDKPEDTEKACTAAEKLLF